MRTLASFPLHLEGPGLILYSPFAMAGVATGARFLNEHYAEPGDVAAAVRAGRLAGCCTGSPGDYHVEVFEGRPDFVTLVHNPWWIILAVEVRDRTVCVRDLFDFSPWNPVCPEPQRIEMPDGFYRLTVGTGPTDSGIFGDNQDLVIMFERVDALPELTWTGIPYLGPELEDE